MKKLAEKFRTRLTCLGENTKKYTTFRVPIETEVTGIDKNGEELQKMNLTYYNLLIVQDLCQPHY